MAQLAQGISQRVISAQRASSTTSTISRIVKGRPRPRALIEKEPTFLPEMNRHAPAGRASILTSLHRHRAHREDQFYVWKTMPSRPPASSYMLENRETMMQMFPELFFANKVRPSRIIPTSCAKP